VVNCFPSFFNQDILIFPVTAGTNPAINKDRDFPVVTRAATMSTPTEGVFKEIYEQNPLHLLLKGNKHLKVTLGGVEVYPEKNGFVPVTLNTGVGAVECRYYPVKGAKKAVVFVGGAGGGWDSPARGLYPRLCRELQEKSIAGLRVRYRHPAILKESLSDVLAGLNFLQNEGIEGMALAGHSFGGAVVIQAASIFKPVLTTVTLATQSYGIEPVSSIGPRCSILLLHGNRDRTLPLNCSELGYLMAQEPKKLLVFDGTGHGLDETAEEVHHEVYVWLLAQLAKKGE
jgi:pimeloyl-ACP methyl ester carboxylesterase